MPLLAVLGAWFSRLVATRIGFWLVAAFAAFGLQLVASSFVIAPLLEQIQDALSGTPANVIGWVRYFNVDRYITGILSAYAAAAAVSGLKLRRG